MTHEIKELFSFSTYRKHLINHTVLLNEHKRLQLDHSKLESGHSQLESNLSQLESDVIGNKENN